MADIRVCTLFVINGKPRLTHSNFTFAYRVLTTSRKIFFTELIKLFLDKQVINNIQYYSC